MILGSSCRAWKENVWGGQTGKSGIFTLPSDWFANLFRTRVLKIPAGEQMNRWKVFFLILIAIAALAVVYGTSVIQRGFSATDRS
jgi:hypothetical protein